MAELERDRFLRRAARAVFGRDGYARASIDVIAAEAGVSTRTLYNHFGGKDDLFASTIEDSAGRVADTLTGIIHHHLGDPDAVTDLPAALTALATAWVRAVDDSADHIAMVRQITAEAGHVPAAVLERWDEAGRHGSHVRCPRASPGSPRPGCSRSQTRPGRRATSWH
ncbi:MAG TPA: helix-turn-helix domain-containing protein [Acidimicrobiales bacterium]